MDKKLPFIAHWVYFHGTKGIYICYKTYIPFVSEVYTYHLKRIYVSVETTLPGINSKDASGQKRGRGAAEIPNDPSTPLLHSVGMTRFELATPRPPDAYSNRTELHPECECKGNTLFVSDQTIATLQAFSPLFSMHRCARPSLLPRPANAQLQGNRVF